MKKTFFLFAVIVITIPIFSQDPYQLTWSEEMKLKKGTSNLSILSADPTGLYFTQERKLADVSDGGAAPTYTLYKLDRKFSPVFEKEYKKEMKGLSFQSFQVLENDLFLFTTDYIKKDQLLKVYGAKIDKNNGELAGGFEELASYRLEANRDQYEIKISPVQKGNSFLMVGNISVGNKLSIGVSLFNKNLEKIETAIINLSFDPALYQLEDVQITNHNKIILLGKENEQVLFGKKRIPRLVFKQYSMALYNIKGEKEKEIELNTDNRYIISGRLIQQETGELLLAGFYSNAAGKTDLNGFFINRVDTERGELQLSSYKEINAGMIGKSFVDAADEPGIDTTKMMSKEINVEEEIELPNTFMIKSVDINPTDHSIVITSELSRLSFSSFYTQRYNSLTRTFTNNWNYIHRFVTRDILLINADKNGNIKWINDLPKSQLEEVKTNDNSYGTGFNYFFTHPGYFAPAGGMPFYSSFKSMIFRNSMVLLFNDHTSNHINSEYGDPVKTVSNFRKRSNIYGVTVNLATGTMSRRVVVTANDEETVLMPRHAFVVNNEFIVPSWRQHLMAKTDLKFAKIVVK